MARMLARLSVLVHVLFVAFAILGGFLAWLAPWVLLPHLASAAWGASVIRWRRACPLSTAENWARRREGRPPLDERGFIAHYVEDRLYPARWSGRVEVGICLLVAGSWFGLAVRG